MAYVIETNSLGQHVTSKTSKSTSKSSSSSSSSNKTSSLNKNYSNSSSSNTVTTEYYDTSSITSQATTKQEAKSDFSSIDKKYDFDISSIAKDVINGKYGNGEERIEKINSAGYNYNEVQNKVNELLGNSKRYEVKPETTTQKTNSTSQKMIVDPQKTQKALEQEAIKKNMYANGNKATYDRMYENIDLKTTNVSKPSSTSQKTQKEIEQEAIKKNMYANGNKDTYDRIYGTKGIKTGSGTAGNYLGSPNEKTINTVTKTQQFSDAIDDNISSSFDGKDIVSYGPGLHAVQGNIGRKKVAYDENDLIMMAKAVSREANMDLSRDGAVAVAEEIRNRLVSDDKYFKDTMRGVLEQGYSYTDSLAEPSKDVVEMCRNVLEGTEWIFGRDDILSHASHSGTEIYQHQSGVKGSEAYQSFYYSGMNRTQTFFTSGTLNETSPTSESLNSIEKNVNNNNSNNAENSHTDMINEEQLKSSDGKEKVETISSSVSSGDITTPTNQKTLSVTDIPAAPELSDPIVQDTPQLSNPVVQEPTDTNSYPGLKTYKYDESNIIAKAAYERGWSPDKIDLAVGISRHETANYSDYKAEDYYNYGGLRKGNGVEPIDYSKGGFALFGSQEDGINSFLNTLESYFDAGRTTPEQLVSNYAPASDGNNEENWIKQVYKDMQ